VSRARVALEAVLWTLVLVVGLLVFMELQGAVHGEEHHNLIVLSLVAFLIIVSSQIAHVLTLPAAIVEIMAGVGAAFVGAHSVEPLAILAGIGANLVLFMAGAEVDVKLIRRRFRSAMEVAALAIIGAAVLGVAVSKVEGLSTEGTLLATAGFAATSAALTFAILQSSGLIRSRRGQIALAAAMITDVVGMILLNLATSGANPLLILYAGIILGALALQPLLPRFTGKGFESELRLIVMTVIVLGSLSEIIGVHSVLTSFILGVVVSETVQSRHVLREKLEGLATGFFTPFFFVASGMSVDPKLLVGNLPLVVGIGLAAFLAKFAPVYLYFHRRAPGKASIVYAASVSPLLTVTIISAQIGQQAGVITPLVYTLMTGAVIVTSLLSSLVVPLVSGRKVQLEAHGL